jgi:hypothetical protein
VFLVGNVKVGSSRPPSAQKFFPIPAAQETQQKIQAHMPEFFLLYERIESAAPGLGSRN